MEFIQWLETQWSTVTAAPLPFIGILIASAGTTAKIMQSYFSSEAAAARERADHFKQLLSEKELDNEALLGKLQVHGEDIATLKRELESRPRVFFGVEEPKDPKPGDIWHRRP